MASDESSHSRTDAGDTDDTPPQSTAATRLYRGSETPVERRDENTPTGIPEEVAGQTTFDPSDVPSKRDHYRWLAKVNQGVGDRSRGTEVHEAGITRDLGVVTARLRCTDHQSERTRWLLDALDLKETVIPSRPIEVAILAVVSLVIDEDRTRAARQQSTDNVTSVIRDNAFHRLLDEFDVTKRDIRYARKQVRETEVYTSPNREL